MALESEDLDSIDRAIIGYLRSDGRMSWRELAERIHLAPTSTADRVHRLEQLGVIEGYAAQVSPAALGLTLRAVVDVNLPPTLDPDAFEQMLVGRPEVAFAAFVAGASDYTLVVDCAGPEGLDRFIRWLKVEAGASRTESNVVLRGVVSERPTRRSVWPV